MAFDFTTFTTLDPNTDFTVSATNITVNTMRLDIDAWSYDDGGAGYIEGNFSFNFEITHDGLSSAGSNIASCFALTNIVDDWQFILDNSGDELCVMVRESGGVLGLELIEIDGGTKYQGANITGLTSGIKYYATIYRDESVGAYGTIYLDLYTDSARTTLFGSSVRDLHSSKKDYRYLWAVQSRNVGSAFWASFKVSNMDGGPTATIEENLAFTESILVDREITIEENLAFTEEIDAISDVLREDIGFQETILVDREITIEENLAFTEDVTKIGNLTLSFGVAGFPSGAATEWRLKDDGLGLVQDWTTDTVQEDVEITGKSSYMISGLEIPDGFQGKLSWRIPGTKYYAVQFLNYLDTGIQQLASLPTLAEIEASTVLAKEASSKRILGLCLDNHVEDDIIRDPAGNKTSSTLYLYDSAANATVHDKATGLIGKVDMTAAYTANRMTLLKGLEA